MNVAGALRRRVLTPDVSATRLEVRGFHVKDAATRDILETVGRSFLEGFGAAAEASRPLDAETPLDLVPIRFRGFAWEGAAMAFAIRDALPSRGGRVRELLAGPGDRHVYMVYVGVGWAMARLPRMFWSRLPASDPLLRWLVLDGYGFHQAYFHTERYVHHRYREPSFPWPSDDSTGYALRAIDQGIGRAMWFVGGAHAPTVLKLLDSFPAERRPDMYSGTGLAATYAGGATESELALIRDHAGPLLRQVAQGSAFGAAARVRAGLVLPHVELATRVFCGLSAADAAGVTDTVLRDLPDGGSGPPYETWRRGIADALTTRNES